MPKKNVSLQIDKEIYSKFKNYCKANAMKISAKLELLMKEEMKGSKKEKHPTQTLAKMFEDLITKEKQKSQKKLH